MARTVQEIYDAAIHLIDAQNENTGATDTSDTTEYRVRAAKLLSTLLNETYPCSDTYNASEYDEDESYLEGECVTSGGWRYLCIADTPVGAEVTDEAYFLKMGRDGRRPTVGSVTALTDKVYMDDYVCLSILPAGLAALFVYDEDPTKYNAFWGDYQNRMAQALKTLPASDGFESVENPYAWEGNGGGIEYGNFGRWAY